MVRSRGGGMERGKRGGNMKKGEGSQLTRIILHVAFERMRRRGRTKKTIEKKFQSEGRKEQTEEGKEKKKEDRHDSRVPRENQSQSMGGKKETQQGNYTTTFLVSFRIYTTAIGTRGGGGTSFVQLGGGRMALPGEEYMFHASKLLMLDRRSCPAADIIGGRSIDWRC